MAFFLMETLTSEFPPTPQSNNLLNLICAVYCVLLIQKYHLTSSFLIVVYDSDYIFGGKNRLIPCKLRQPKKLKTTKIPLVGTSVMTLI